jgi:type IV secretory pathway TrbD component
VGMFFALYLFARWATRTDPQILRLLLNSTKIRTQYDPMKFEPVQVRRLHGV